MISILLKDLMADKLHLTGEIAAAGIYREIGTDRQIQIQAGDRLPPGPDGSATAYVCLHHAGENPSSHEDAYRHARG
jgi:hypothetical protein